MATNLDRSKDFFQNLSKDNLSLVDQFYDANVIFQDPIHKLRSASEVKAYYAGLYTHASSIRFEYGSAVESGSTVSLEWKMFLKTPAIASGSEITVDGVSIIKFNPQGKAIEHRDYFDMGEFVYERISVLGWVIKYIKGRMGAKQN